MPTTNVLYMPQFEPGIYQPVFDPTGEQSANAVSGERHTLTAANGRNSQRLVPLYAPFFYDPATTQLVHTPPGGSPRILVQGVDFVPAFHFIGATRGCRKPVYGGFEMVDNQLEGQVTIAYHTLGGGWIISQSEINRILTDMLINPRFTAWEQVVDVPSVFPVIEHEWNLNDLVGMSEVQAQLEAIAEAIANRPAPVINPPYVDPTKTTVGLGNVDNFSTATDEEAILGDADNLFVTPHAMFAAIMHHRQVVMLISTDEGNRAMLGSDDGAYVPEMQIAPLHYYNEVAHPEHDPIDANNRPTEDLEIEFARGIAMDIAQLYANQGVLPNLLTEEKSNLVGAINELFATALQAVSYEMRSFLRGYVPRVRGTIIVEGLGLFYHQLGSQEPDDDETCFSTVTGRWLLASLNYDLLEAQLSPVREDLLQQAENFRLFRSRFMQVKAHCPFHSVLSVARVSFLVPFKGIGSGDQIFANVSGDADARLVWTARYEAKDTARVYLSNPSAEDADLRGDEVVTLTAIRDLSAMAVKA